MPDILEQNKIPYFDQAKRLFNLFGEGTEKAGKQQIVPFLGAGVSISERSFNTAAPDEPAYPDQAKIESVLADLGLQDSARVFLQMAILLACHLQAAQSNIQAPSDTALINKFKVDTYPPSAPELAQLFSTLAKYTTFERVVERLRKAFPGNLFTASDQEVVEMLKLFAIVTGLANPPDSLTSITSYFEKISGRDSLYDYLRLTISNKGKYTRTHLLIATAAQRHFAQEVVAEDYLIITTNYDLLMEKALDEVKVPYVILTVKNSDHKVHVRFADWMDEAKEQTEKFSDKKYPTDFTLQDIRKLVVVYKIHGCLAPDIDAQNEGIIISDNDYVNYVSQMSTQEGAIPAHVHALMQGKPFLFLGYSLNDWNVRSIFETLTKKRNPTRDFSVMYSVRDFEKIFFDKNDVQILRTDLKNYIDGLLPHLPDEAKNRLSNHGK